MGRERLATVDAETISVSIVETNDPVEAGEFLEVTGEVESAGPTEGRVEFDFVVGDDVIATRRIGGLEGGETRSVEFHHRTYPVGRDVTFPVAIEAPADRDERTVSVYGIDDLDEAAVRPDREIAVQPGSTVLFEVAPDHLEEFGGQTHWYLGDAYAGYSSGPWYAAYAAEADADHWRHTFETPGRHAVVASVTGEENASARWSVRVEDGGAAAPTIDAARPSPGSIDVDGSETVEFELDVLDPTGGLDRVVWWLEQADAVLGVSDVEGSEDTAALSVEGSSLCHTCAVVPWVISESGLVSDASVWTVNRRFDGEIGISIAETNDPVEAGSFLEVIVEVENRGDATASQEIRLEVGDEDADSAEIELGGGETDRVSLGYDTYPVRRDVRFPIRIVGESDSATKTVDVFADAPGDTRVDILETNAPVGAGEFLEVVADLEHTGDASVTRRVHLVAGDRVDTAERSLSPGETATVALGYDTYPVEQDVEFPVVVETDGHRDKRSVRVFADGVPSFRVTGLEANDPIEAGEFLGVAATLENAGESERTDEVRLVVGGEVVDSTSATIAAGASETVALGYDTYPVEQDVEFPVTVETDADAGELTVEVIAAADTTSEVEFHSCQRAAVSGEFTEGDTLSASTGFYDLAGFGNTIREDWLTVGEHVEAPFEGTVVFEVGDESDVSSDGDEAVVTVREYGLFGTAISGVRTPDAAPGQGFNHENPHDCRDVIRPERPTLSVIGVIPLEGAALEVSFEAENPNGVAIPAESAFVGSTIDDPPEELEAGTTATTAEWTPESREERLAWEVDFSRFEYDDLVRAETEPAGAYLPDSDLDVRIVDANDPVEAGEFLEVTVDVTNPARTDRSDDVRLVVGGEVVDSTAVTVAGGTTDRIALGYQTAAVEQNVRFSVTVESGADADTHSVEVRGREPAADGETGADSPVDDASTPDLPVDDSTETEGSAESDDEMQAENETIAGDASAGAGPAGNATAPPDETPESDAKTL